MRADQILLGRVARHVLPHRRLFFFDGQHEIPHGWAQPEEGPGCCVLGTEVRLVDWADDHTVPVYRLSSKTHDGPCRAAGWRVKELFS
jgi:hypothetical protein